MLVDRPAAETSAFQALRSKKQTNNTVKAVTRRGNGGLLATDPHTCCLCNRVLSNRNHLKEHLERFHRRSTKFSCDLCPKFYFVKNELKIHMKRVHKTKHVKKTECSICGKLVMNIRLHLHVHEEKEQCAICQKMIQKRIMKNHMRIHVVKKCKSCDETFFIKEELKR